MDKFGIKNISSVSLDNGLQIYVNERHNAPIVTVQAWVKTGSIHEEEYLGCGISHFLEHMLFHGSKKYPGAEIVDTIHSLGGDMNAYTSLGHTVYYIEVPANHVEKAIDILTDMLVNPIFPEEKFLDEKNIILRERDMHGDNPSRVMSERVWHEMFTVHPARHPIIGYKNKIEAVNRDMMVDYHQRRYSPDRTFFLVSGMVETDGVIKALVDRLGSWNRGDLREPFMPEEPIQLSSRDSTYFFTDPLTRLSMSWHIPPGGHPDVAALDILSGILGQNKSSRLVKNLKIRKNLALSVGCFSYTPSFCGIFGINALCMPENTEELEEELRNEIRNLANFKKSELEREVAQLETEYIRALRSNNCVVRIIGNSILSYGSPLYVNKYIDDLRAVTIPDLERVTNEYLDLEKSTTIRIIPKASVDLEESKPAVHNISDCIAIKPPELKTFRGGQKLVTFKDKSLPLLDIGIVMAGGAYFEERGQAGITGLMSVLLNAGTKTYPEMELLHLMDENAIELSITPGNNSLAIKLNCHKKKFPLALEVLQSILTESSFGARQFKREKKIAVEKLKSRQVSPQGCAEDRILNLLYGDHPYGISRQGAPQDIEKLTRQQVMDFYFNQCLRPDMAVFGIAGDFDNRVVKKIEKLISTIPWNNSPPLKIAPPEFPAKTIVERVKNPRKQAVVLNAVPGCDNLDKARFSVDILQAAMTGQGANIFKKVRDEAGLAYYTGMITSRGFHRGYISFYAGTHPEAADQVAEMMDNERQRLAETGLTQEEFNAAKAFIAHSKAELMEDPGSMLMQFCLAEYYGNGYLTPFRHTEIFDKITLNQTNKVVKKLMSYPAPVTVISEPDSSENPDE